jgi:hypothetical protein
MHPRTSFVRLQCLQRPDALGNGILGPSELRPASSCGPTVVGEGVLAIKFTRVLSSVFLFVVFFPFPS